MTCNITITINVRVRWWFRPVLWLAGMLARAAGALATLAAMHGVKAEV